MRWHGCGRAAGFAVVGFLVVACKSNNAGTPAPAPSTTPADDLEAQDAAGTIAKLHPLRCDAGHAEWKWATCHDETIGFDNLVACLKEAKGQADSALSRLPGGKVSAGACGSKIEEAVRSNVTATAAYLADLEVWLSAHGATLRGRMRTKSLQDACEGTICDDRPESSGPKYQGFLFSEDSLSCTKALFRCGAPDNVCFIGKVAARLGAACGPKENHVSGDYHDRLSVRSTGTIIR